jgi:5'-nucleotidase
MSTTSNGASADPRPLILICNDDGIDAPGIIALASALDGLGELHVAAPVDEQSAVGHAITVRLPVRAHTHGFEVPSGPIAAHAINGTPADCIKLAVNHLVPRVPDLVVSGINHGPNTAVNILYSGTVSAATEAAILGLDSVAFSLCRWKGGDFETAGAFARQIVRQILARQANGDAPHDATPRGKGLPAGTLLNVNIPDRPAEEMEGIKVTRQARSRWDESFVERQDPFGRTYYWLAGEFVNLDTGDDTDLAAIDDGFVSVTPIHFDLTAYDALEAVRGWDWSETEDEAETAHAEGRVRIDPSAGSGGDGKAHGAPGRQ